MSMTLLGWILIVSSLATIALLILPLRWREAAARLPLLSRMRSSSTGLGLGAQRPPGTLLLAAGAFLLVAGFGAVASYVKNSPGATSPRHTAPVSLSHYGLDGETLADLRDYTQSIGSGEPAPTATAGELLPDVETMIERLAARLQAKPDDIEGWRMLGWSYFHTARYEQAETAYARAVKLDPSSAELKLAYEESKAKASGGDPGGQSAEASSADVR